VPMGLKVGQRQVYETFGIEEPGESDVLLVAPVLPPAINAGSAPSPGPRAEKPDDGSAEGDDPPTPESANDDTPEQIAAAQRALSHAAGPDWADKAVDALIAQDGWEPELGDLEERLAKCTTEAEAQSVIASAIDTIGLDKFSELLAKVRFNARGAGVTNE
jgi:hypothetical protein